MKRDHNPLRYLPWLLRDAVVWPLRVFLILIVLFTVVAWRFATNMQLPRHPLGGATSGAMMATDVAQVLQYGVWGTCLTVAILMTMGGIPGTDLERGYYRSWFSKPMTAIWYYLQRYLIGAAVILILPPILGLGIKIALGGSTGLNWTMEGQVALAYLVVASACFLASRFVARGWLIVFLIDILQTMLEPWKTSGFMPKALLWLHAGLPPFHKLGISLPIAHGGDLWLILGYGTAMLVAALVLLRVRPLGAGVSA
jgi:hypothetical protein